ncbi:MAG: PQQ-dependent sugar dehydrogenase [Bdellovibrionales bacterium]|nr:PQQ-dependent sugar dehydrogenase [Bdellovibrionales bacterium]
MRSKVYLPPLAALSIITVLVYQNCGGKFEAANFQGTSSNAVLGPNSRPALQALNFPIAPTGSPVAPILALETPFPNLSFSAGSPLFLDHAGDSSNRLFALFQSGSIEVFENQDNVSASSTFLDISSKVASPAGNGGGNEEGLLGLAFDPDFSSNGYFYVYYSAANQRRSVISRFSVNPSNTNQALPNSERVLLEVDQPASNHNGGCMRFGPDGYLYIAFGDGGGANDTYGHGQNTLTYHSTMIRINPIDGEGSPAYVVPADNPFVGDSNYLPEIYAFGLRNPWRFSFDRETGELWLADVGQGAREEINKVEMGDNLGWPFREGLIAGPDSSTPPNGLKDPVFDYPRSDGISVTGGFVYRGNRHPALRGLYFFGDLTGPLYVHNTNSDADPLYSNTNMSAGSLVSFGEDEDGELYVMSFSNGIQRIVNNAQSTVQESDYAAPSNLSETGLFVDTANMIPNPGLLEYEVNVPLWSDYAQKKRWLAVPNGRSLRFSSTDDWEFPVGTVTVKHCELELSAGQTTRLETRVFVRQNRGWRGYTYKWNAQQTDAVLLTAAYSDSFSVAESATGGARNQTWNYPSRNQCMACHTAAAGFVLGINTFQQNRMSTTLGRIENLLSAWGRLGILNREVDPAVEASFPSWANQTGSSENLSRAYLDVNCAFCHQPANGNPSPMDLRYTTSLANSNVVGSVVTSGDSANSSLAVQMNIRGGGQMPPLGSEIVDQQALDLITHWIDNEL